MQDVRARAAARVKPARRTFTGFDAMRIIEHSRAEGVVFNTNAVTFMIIRGVAVCALEAPILTRQRGAAQLLFSLRPPQRCKSMLTTGREHH
jgi:hypothetical protein